MKGDQVSLKRLWGITRNRGEVGGDVLPGITLVALSKKLSILILNCAFGVVTCCGITGPQNETLGLVRIHL